MRVLALSFTVFKALVFIHTNTSPLSLITDLMRVSGLFSHILTHSFSSLGTHNNSLTEILN